MELLAQITMPLDSSVEGNQNTVRCSRVVRFVDDDTTGWMINAHGFPRRPKGRTVSIHGTLPTDN